MRILSFLAGFLRGWIHLILLLIILLTATFLHVGWGIKKELPYYPNIDEPAFVEPAVKMAAEASLNPKSFQHPGSTVIYPLMAIFRLRHFMFYHGPIFGRMPGIALAFELDSSSFYLLGRGLSIFYAVVAILFVYLVGDRAFGWKVGLLGAWLSSICWLSVCQAQLVRTDGAITFFGLVALYLCLRFYQRSGWRSLVMAGVSIGLAIATKYSMISLVGVWVLANLFLLLEGKRSKTQLAGGIIIGLVVAVLAFNLATPFFGIELKTALANIQNEMRSFHLGADGLSPLGNLFWYLGTAIPDKIGWPRSLLAAASAGYILVERNHARLLILAYPVVFIAGISYSSLHWSRWLIPIFPIISLLAARVIVDGVDWITDKISSGKLLNGVFLAASIFAVSYTPAMEIAHNSIRQARPSTRILARKWLEESLPEGAIIAREAYTPHLQGIPCKEVFEYRLSYKSLEWYRSVGVRYFLTSSMDYSRYFAEPERYSQQIFFYRQLFDEGNLLVEFSPSKLNAPGSIVSIYELDP